MKLETFSYLPPMNEAMLRSQIQYMIDKGYAPAIEYSETVDTYNSYWSMWGLPMFEIRDAAAVVYELKACQKANDNCYIKINGFDPSTQAQAISFVAYTPNKG
ncbi:MAG: ribulose bisphosphate carboxylase small subunit [Chloroflexi bacterium]|uniref:Ribulose bisphosphate carboxylase small subunit n=1 Tax=Candidatus Chlorohelix allophototropha TaxID=3003348 RepID=A0A8T7LQV0_9CHLR|nr:ribulose bisphosphate carboxylase small subunit [Chloroflexota bacterium]WJW66306.1 ribulose bisphosphate carboxylase small subunit [Chloroflexota bacterium L227-S17]